MTEIKVVLQSEYAVVADSISPINGGRSALAYRVDSAQGVYFLKVYDKRKSGTMEILEKQNLCMGVSSWLESNTALKGRINAPLLTKHGEFKIETQNYAYLLFSYIDGIVPQGTSLSICQQQELAEIVGELHRYGADIPFDFSSIQETYEIPCAELMKLPRKTDEPLCIKRHYDMLMQAIEQAHEMAEHVKSLKLPFVLCHIDIHGWNLVQSDKLVLIDWESIKFAPAEADLYTFWGDWYLGDSKWVSYWDAFLPVYHKLRPDYIIREEVLKFYQLRRRIEDIEEFYTAYLYDDLTKEEISEVVSGMERECEFLSTLIGWFLR